MEEIAIRKLKQVGKLLYTEGLVDARAGNLSVRLKDKIVITRRGSHLGNLQDWDFISLPLKEAHPLSDRASSELVVHKEIYLQTDYLSVVHAHPVGATLLSFERDYIEPIDSEGKDLLGRVQIIPAYPSGSLELARAVAFALRSSKLVVVRSHGVFSADLDPFYAYAHISVLERSCKILLYERGKIQRL